MQMNSSRTGGDAVVAVDQGTSSTKAVVISADGAVLSRASVQIPRSDPRPGWVEQDPIAIRDSVDAALDAALEDLDVDVVAMGISNQRESALIWDKSSGRPLGPMLGWQDRRTRPRATELYEAGWDPTIRAKTGLPLDPMFSALKFEWLLNEVDPSRALARSGRIAIGTVDSWILYSLTGEHRIEIGNASRTQLLNLQTGDWDDELLALFNIPRQCLPRVAASNEESGPLLRSDRFHPRTRIAGVLGDSHAALYAHHAWEPGQVKITYGSGSSLMGLMDPGSGEHAIDSAGLVRTIAWRTTATAFAFEGTILSTGATLVWLSKVLQARPEQLNAMAQAATDENAVQLVPAFAGLGAPYWDEEAIALICGFGLGTTPADLARAGFDSIVMQTDALLSAVAERSGTRLETIFADGGPTQNDWLMQRQADVSDCEVVRSNIAELSATGAAHLAGVTCGLWSDEACAALPRDRSPFRPNSSSGERAGRRERWSQAVARSQFRPPEPGVPLP